MSLCAICGYNCSENNKQCIVCKQNICVSHSQVRCSKCVPKCCASAAKRQLIKQRNKIN